MEKFLGKPRFSGNHKVLSLFTALLCLQDYDERARSLILHTAILVDDDNEKTTVYCLFFLLRLLNLSAL